MPDPANEPQPGTLSTGTTPPTDVGHAGQGIPELPAFEMKSAGRFLLRGEIARGGMGIVYDALDPQFGRDVAVKTLSERLGSRPDALRRFDEESRITGQLQHPGIPAVFEWGFLDDGRPFLAMKLVKGRTLAELLDGGGPNRSDLIPAFEKVCQAIAYAHSRRVIHRDLKPANVMVGAFGEVQVMDWGLAKVLGERPEAKPVDPDATAVGTQIQDPRSASGGSETQAGSILGTLAYMPPEQAAGAVGSVDERADVFGLGAILCVILTGRPPYAGADAEELRLMAVRGKLGECRARLDASGADPEWVALAWRCLSPEVADRPRNAGEVSAAVADLRRQADDRARQAELERARTEARVAEAHKRRRVKLALAASLLCLVVLGGGGAWWARQQATERRLMEQVRDERERRVREGVEEVFARLPELYDRALWAQAEASLDQAAHILGEGDAESRECVAAARRDTAFLRRLDEIRMGKLAIRDGNVFDSKGAVPKYESAFRDRGLDIDSPDEDEFVRRLDASPVRAHLLAALDDWAFSGGTKRRRLFAIMARATGHPWRSRLADAFGDGERMAKVYDAIPAGERSPGLIVGISRQLERLGQDGIRRLDDGLRQYPRDFWLHVWSGVLRRRTQPDLRVGAYRAALAIRPEAAPVFNNLGLALVEKHDLAGAIACYKEAIRLDGSHSLMFENLGNASRAAGDLDGAIAAYEEAIRIAPRRAAGYNDLGVAWKAKGDIGRAVTFYQKAIHVDPKYARAYLNLGGASKAQGDLDGAIAYYRKATRADPKYTLAYENLGLALRAKRDAKGSIRAFEEAIRIDPKYMAARGNLGNVLRLEGDLAGALACFEEAIRIEPRYAYGWNGLGVVSKAQGDLGGAIAAFKEAIRLDPRYAIARRNLGEALNEKGDFDGAVIAYREAARIDPKNVSGQNKLGLALGSSNDLVGAMDAYAEGAHLDPKYASAHFGNAPGRRRDFTGAIAGFREVIRVDPKFGSAHYNLGRALVAQGDLAGAVAAFEGAIAQDPKSPSTHYYLGFTWKARGELDRAIAEYQSAIRLNPRYAAPHVGMGFALRSKGEYAKAVAAFETAVRLAPLRATGHAYLGYGLNAAGDLDGAIAAYREAVRVDPKYVLAYTNLGLALSDKGDVAGAISAFEEAARRDPKSVDARANLGLAFLKQGRWREAGKALDAANALLPGGLRIARERRAVDRLRSLDRRLAAVARGDEPEGPSEAVEFAKLASQPFRGRYALAYRLFLAAFAGDAKEVEPNLYEAARAAVRFAAGDDPDDRPTGKRGASARKQALEWLYAGLTRLRGLAASAEPPVRQQAAFLLRLRLRDAALASVRDPKRLAELSPEVRDRWEAVWAGVRSALAQADGKP